MILVGLAWPGLGTWRSPATGSVSVPASPDPGDSLICVTVPVPMRDQRP
jgi:hypothetical protein